MSILGPFMLAVLLPLHFVASRESHNTLDFLSRLDIGNLPRSGKAREPLRAQRLQTFSEQEQLDALVPRSCGVVRGDN